MRKPYLRIVENMVSKYKYSIAVVFLFLMSCDVPGQYAYSGYELAQLSKDEFEKLVIRISKDANLTLEDMSFTLTKRQQKSGVAHFVSTSSSNIEMVSQRFDFGVSRIYLYEPKTGVSSEEIRKFSKQVEKLIEQSGIEYTILETKPSGESR